MRTFAAEMPGTRRYVDHLLIASILLLIGTGLVSLYSSSYASAEWSKEDGLFFIKRQLIFSAIGFVFFIALAVIKLEIIRKLFKPVFIFCLFICFLAAIPGIGIIRNNATRWIGTATLSYQPSELAKLMLPLYLAHIFDKKSSQGDLDFRQILPPVILTFCFALLICMQNNFSTAFLLTFNAILIFYFAGMKKAHIAGVVLFLAPLGALLVMTHGNRLRRILGLLERGADPHGMDYQINRSLEAISSGGLLGKGLGQGTIYVPEIHSDFVFSSFVEESGLIGILLFVGLFTVFAVRGYIGAMRNQNQFNRILGLGLVTIIITQALFNIAIVVGLLPVSGLPLPFFSAGGSSLLTSYCAAGLIVNISGSRNEIMEI